ncbi:sulfatase [Gemmatimonadota bacterium]
MPSTTRRQFIETSLTAASSAALASMVGCGRASRAAGKRPNLLFVFPDQMRGQALGFLGEDPVITPNLDRFAAEGLALTQAAVNYPVCSPYRAMMLTGKYAHSNGVLGNCNSASAPFGYEMHDSSRCWSDILTHRGYSLGYIGKWHLDSPYRPYVGTYNNTEEMAWNEWTAPHRRHGFDYWYAYGTYDNHNKPEYWTTDAPRTERVVVDQWSPEHEADKAIAYIRNDGGSYRDPKKPFALVVSMNPPHMPYQLVPQKYLDMYGDATAEDLINRANVDLDHAFVPGQAHPHGDVGGLLADGADLARRHLKNYFAQTTGVDDQFGRIIAALGDEGLEEDTIVVFTSDHGNCIGCHNQVSKNVHYEESMRVPFLIRWPGAIRSGTDELLISTPDILPTLLDLMGFASDVPVDTEGASHASLLRGGSGRRPSSQLYMWTPLGVPAMGRRGVRTNTHTMVVCRNEGRSLHYVLHDNVNDPYQLRNIASEQRSMVQDLVESELKPWLEKNRDPWLDV